MRLPTGGETRFRGRRRGPRGWVVGVVAALTLLSTTMSGCFRYVEMSDPATQVPVDVRLRVAATDGEHELTDKDGYVTGKLLGWTGETATLVWSSGPGLSDFSAPSYRDVEIARRRILSIEMREMDRTKTALWVAGAVIAAAISFSGVLSGGVAGGSPPPSPPGDLAIIPIR